MTEVLYTGYNRHAQDASDPEGKLPVPESPPEFTARPHLGSPERVIAAYNAVATVEGGKARAVGGGGYGQRCDASYSARAFKLVEMLLPEPIVDIDLKGHGIAIAGGAVHTWGADLYGTRGDGIDLDGKEGAGQWAFAEPYSPTLPPSGDAAPVQVANGSEICGVLLDSGQAVLWGHGKQGAIGDGTLLDKPSPTLVKQAIAFVELVCGGQFSMARSAENDVYVWGMNNEGQLGLGDRNHRLTPTQVPGLKAKSLHAEGVRAWAIDENDSLIEWGAGQSTPGYAQAATRTLPAVRQIDAGDYHQMLVDVHDEVWAKGSNLFGELGLGNRTGTAKWTPTGTAAQAVSAGFQFSCALA